MLQRDKENLEQRLQQLKEDAKEDFFEAQQVFLSEYEIMLENIFSSDSFGIKGLLTAYFELTYVDMKSKTDDINIGDIFQKSLTKSLVGLPLSSEKKQEFKKLILQLQSSQKPKTELYHSSEQLIHDPYFPIIEDMAIDGVLTREEFYALEFSYTRNGGDLKKTLNILTPQVRALIFSAIEHYESLNRNESEVMFRNEYAREIGSLEKSGIQTSQVIAFVARSYYKNPGRYKKYEHPKRRLKRTFKLSLLRLLRKKLGNIDAENILRRFEEGETFFDLFHIISEILEILPENPQSYEVYTASNALEEAEDILSEAESTQEKILKGQKLTTSVSKLIGETDAELDSEVLSRLLDASTDFVGEDIYFRSNLEEAGVLAEGKKIQESDDDEEDDDYSKLSPRGAYEAIKNDFLALEKEKTKAFLEGRYDDIDTYNEKLFVMQRKLEKLAIILGEEL
ncbi:hypothetical protein LAT59_01990 [Candidatus Gracilibacteria bacterium]|nr:hypothetical protein [Candidatus Gracilibacteria bacterium]